jgi:phosphoglycerate dehydrogenase-like enzyme
MPVSRPRPGSNASVAVLDMMDHRPIWAMPEWVPREIDAALPEGWTLRVLSEATDGSGDGATRVARPVLEAVADARIYFGYGIPAELLEAAPHLEWVHTGSAGVGSSLTPAMLESRVVFTNSAGIHAPPIAETVLGMLLHFGRGFDIAVRNQAARRWSTEGYYVADAPLAELSTSTVGIVGFGGIGREVARRVAALGARVVALKRHPPRAGENELEPVGGAGSLAARIELVHGEAGLDRVLTESDALVVAAPDTPETRGFIDGAALARMRRGAVLINVARGKLVDEQALVEALVAGRLRGAGLDVFAKEPLASDHPLWDLDRVLITPHVSAVARGFWRRETDLIVRNLRRYANGAPAEEWENVVDKGAGY